MQGSDVERVAEIHVAAWRVAYEGIVSRERTDSLSVAKTVGTLRRRLAEPHANYIVGEWRGELIGFTSHGPVRDTGGLVNGPGVAEIYSMYVHPDHWGRGCGRALVDAVVARLSGEWSELVLWTLEENPAACAFYASVGFQAVPGSARPRPDLGARVVLYRLPLV